MKKVNPGRRLQEASWLAALVLLPWFFHSFSTRVFEAEKIAVLRSLAVLGLAGVLLEWVAAGPRPRRVAEWVRNPVVIGVAVFTLVSVVATFTSIAPRISLLGSFFEQQGLYTQLCYVVLFVLMVRGLNARRALDAIVFASIPVVLYAVLQLLSLDPIPWDRGGRVGSSFGNPMLLSGYLAVVIPLTGARLWMAWREREHARARIAIVLSGVAIALQLGVLVAAQGRGAWIALAGGVGLAVLWGAASLRHRRTALITVVVATLLVAAVGALGSATRNTLSARTRVLLWTAASSSTRFLGTGPDTQALALSPHVPKELTRLEFKRVVASRAHNETWDVLVTRGVPGLVAWMALIGLALLAMLRRSGVPGGARVWVFMGGLALIVSVPIVFVDTSWRMLGLTLPAGWIGGWAAWCFRESFLAETPRPRKLDPLVVGAGAALLVHLLEIQVGVSSAVTRLLFFTLLAMLVAKPRADEPRTDRGLTAAGFAALGLVVFFVTMPALTLSATDAEALVRAVTQPITSMHVVLLLLVLVAAAVWRWRGRVAVVAVLVCLPLTAFVVRAHLHEPRSDAVFKLARDSLSELPELQSEVFEVAIRESPTQDFYYLMYARSLAEGESRNFGKAAVLMRTARELSPHDVNHAYGLARSLHADGKVEESLPHYEDAARLSPIADDIFIRWGIALEQAGRIEEAREAFRRAREIRASSP